ncbi:MAG: hypothetical protein ACOC22_02930 [bacterium]
MSKDLYPPKGKYAVIQRHEDFDTDDTIPDWYTNEGNYSSIEKANERRGEIGISNTWIFDHKGNLIDGNAVNFV